MSEEGSTRNLEVWKQNMLAHARQYERLMDVERYEPTRLYSLVEQAFTHTDPREHWHAYERLKEQVIQMVGWECKAPALRTSSHYDLMIYYIDWMLTQAELSVQINGPVVESSPPLPPSSCYTWLGEALWPLPEKTFESIDQTFAPELHQQLRAYASGDTPLYNMTITGNVGAHISHLLAATCNKLAATGVKCRYMTGQGLFDAEQRYSFGHYSRLLNEAMGADLLVIDRVDVVTLPDDHDHDDQTDLFYFILDARELKKLPTILTAAGPDIVPFIGEASFSRMHVGGVFIEVK